jgi:hypothetical protein
VCFGLQLFDILDLCKIVLTINLKAKMVVDDVK